MVGRAEDVPSVRMWGLGRLSLNAPLDCVVNPLLTRHSMQRQVLPADDEETGQEAAIKQCGDQIACVGQRGDPRNGIHAPVEAERGRQQHQLSVECGQVEERKEPGPRRRILGRGIVRGGEGH